MRMNFGFGETYCSGCHYCIGYFLQPPCTVVLSRLFFFNSRMSVTVAMSQSLSALFHHCSFLLPAELRTADPLSPYCSAPLNGGIFSHRQEQPLSLPCRWNTLSTWSFSPFGGKLLSAIPSGGNSLLICPLRVNFSGFFFVKLTRRKHFRKFSQVYWKIDLWFPPKLILRSSLWSPTV